VPDVTAEGGTAHETTDAAGGAGNLTVDKTETIPSRNERCPRSRMSSSRLDDRSPL